MLQGDAETPAGVDVVDLRPVIRETCKLRITYRDSQERETEGVVWPVAMAYYADVTLLGAWCELCSDFRHFRVERIITSVILDSRFPTEGDKMMERWFALQGARKQLQPYDHCRVQPPRLRADSDLARAIAPALAKRS